MTFRIALLFLLLGQPLRAETVLASVDDGKPTKFDGGFYHGLVATGEKFNPKRFAIAHRTLPFGTCVQLCFRRRCVWPVIVNDRGPCLTAFCQKVAPYLLKREVDMTPALAKTLRFPGLAKVTMNVGGCQAW